MASAPPLPAGFEEMSVAAASPAPVTSVAANSNTTPSGMNAETYRSTLDHLVNTGASRDQIMAFVQSAGFTPEQLRGLEASLAYRDDPANKGKIPRIEVLPIRPEAPQIQHDMPGQAEAAADALPEGFEEVSLDHLPNDNAPHTWGGELALGLRNIMEGAAAIPDFVAGGLNSAVNAVTGSQLGTHPFGDLATQGADALGLPVASSDADKLVAAAVRGGAGGMITAGAGGVPALIGGTLSGVGSGGATELAAQNGAGPVGQLAAGLAGGLAGVLPVAGIGAAANALSRQRELSPVMQAFERQNVPALAADVGGVGARMATGAANTTLGGIPIHEAAQASIAAARAARDRIAAGIGNVAGDATAAGNAAQAGAKSFMESTQQTAKKLYNAIPIAADRDAVLTNSKQALADLTAGMKSNPELSSVISDPRMQRIASAIQGKIVQVPTGVLDSAGNPIMRDVQQGGALSWQDLKDFRSYIGEKAGAPALQSDTPQANLKALYGALSEDMKATAQAEGPKAYAAFNRANNYWRARQSRIENVVTPILGKDLAKTPEAAFRQIESWAGDKGSFVRTAQALRTMPQEEADSVRATIFAKLGNASAGNQNAAADVFSPSTFLTQWNKLPERTRNVLFPGKEYQKDISDILAITEAQKGATQFANSSKTATAMHIAGNLATLVMNPVAGIASMGGQFGVGKLLASPSFARWLASSAKKPNPAAQLAHINRLTKIAAANPVIANDVLALQERLAQAFTGPQPIAAQGAGSDQ